MRKPIRRCLHIVTNPSFVLDDAGATRLRAAGGPKISGPLRGSNYAWLPRTRGKSRNRRGRVPRFLAPHFVLLRIENDDFYSPTTAATARSNTCLCHLAPFRARTTS